MQRRAFSYRAGLCGHTKPSTRTLGVVPCSRQGPRVKTVRDGIEKDLPGLTLEEIPSKEDPH